LEELLNRSLFFRKERRNYLKTGNPVTDKNIARTTKIITSGFFRTPANLSMTFICWQNLLNKDLTKRYIQPACLISKLGEHDSYPNNVNLSAEKIGQNDRAFRSK
jgi:hypothetical protein